MEGKIAIIDHVGRKAGMDSYDIALSQAFNKQGCEVVVYSNFEYNEPGYFNVFQFKVSENLFSFFRMLLVCERISKEFLRLGIQQCIVHGFRFGFAEWMMLRALKKPSIKMNMIVHDPGNLLGLKHSTKWRRKIFELCDAIIVHNNYSAGELSKDLNDSENRKVVVIPHGHFIDAAVTESDMAGFKKGNLPEEGKKYLLFFGHIKRTKGLDLLLKALVHTSPGVSLIIAGRMRKHGFDEYQAIIDEHKLQDRIKIFPGYITPEMRNDLFHSADVIVLPYRKVFQSGVMLMAMSYGKAVIASDLLPNREVINDNVNGFLFKAGDEDSLTSTIEKVLGNETLRNEIAKAGRNYVEVNHDWNSIASQWIKLFGK